VIRLIKLIRLISCPVTYQSGVMLRTWTVISGGSGYSGSVRFVLSPESERPGFSVAGPLRTVTFSSSEPNWSGYCLTVLLYCYGGRTLHCPTVCFTASRYFYLFLAARRARLFIVAGYRLSGYNLPYQDIAVPWRSG